MKENNFVSETKKKPEHGGPDTAWMKAHVADLHLPVPFTVLPTVSCSDAVEILKSQGIDQLPVVTENNEILGTITEGNVCMPSERPDFPNKVSDFVATAV